MANASLFFIRDTLPTYIYKTVKASHLKKLQII